MPQSSNTDKIPIKEHLHSTEGYYKELLKQTLVRLILLYMAPFLLVIGFFLVQYRSLHRESREAHLKTTAEHHAYMLDLFLNERLVNLSNLIDNPKLPIPPSDEEMEKYLESLKKTSDSFIDLGFFDKNGISIAYSGPYREIESKNYSSEKWFLSLKENPNQYIITDIYLGFREKPHFTIAVNREKQGEYTVVRAVISPQKINERLTTLENSEDVLISIINKAGQYQIVPEEIGTLLEQSSLHPDAEPWLGLKSERINKQKLKFAYAWLKTAPWALIVRDAYDIRSQGLFMGIYGKLILFAVAFFILEFFLVLFRARTVVRRIKETEAIEADLSGQLVHAARLASVGELAAGIAHEINNPLAIIAEEVGLVKDCMNPEFGEEMTQEELSTHLDNMYVATFRARDITSKLLGFVRQKAVKLEEHSFHDIIDEVIDGILGSEFTVSSIKIVRNYCPTVPRIFTDKNQLVQVFLNLVKNAFDAMSGDGTLTIHTTHSKETITISIRDTGYGMSREQLEKIFMPFYTTKQVGKGTGLGLSVSYGILKNLDGKIYVDSQPGKGSMFTVELPIDLRLKS